MLFPLDFSDAKDMGNQLFFCQRKFIERTKPEGQYIQGPTFTIGKVKFIVMSLNINKTS